MFKQIKQGLQKWREHKIGRFAWWGGSVAMVWFGLHTTLILFDGFTDEDINADVAVILGNKVHKDGRLSLRLKSRLDAAVALYRKGKVRLLITSGELGAEGHQEAHVMAQYLKKQGIPAEDVLADPKGANTYHTARNTRRIMRKRGLRSVIAVSNAYHISRCKLAFRRFGVREVYGAHAQYPDWWEPWSIFREFVAYYAYMLKRYPDRA